MISKEQLDSIRLWQPDRLMYGQSEDQVKKYRETYSKTGQMLRKYPEIATRVTALGLGSTHALHTIRSIFKAYGKDDAALVHYYNCEWGRGQSKDTLETLINEAIPAWQGLPISVVKDNILNVLNTGAGRPTNRDPRLKWIRPKPRTVNFIDYDSTTSLTGADGRRLPRRLVNLLDRAAEDRCLLQLNLIVKCFRVDGSWGEFFSKQLPQLINVVKTKYNVVDETYTAYSTRKYHSTTQMGGCILLLDRKKDDQEYP